MPLFCSCSRVLPLKVNQFLTHERAEADLWSLFQHQEFAYEVFANLLSPLHAPDFDACGKQEIAACFAAEHLIEDRHARSARHSDTKPPTIGPLTSYRPRGFGAY